MRLSEYELLMTPNGLDEATVWYHQQQDSDSFVTCLYQIFRQLGLKLSIVKISGKSYSLWIRTSFIGMSYRDICKILQQFVWPFWNTRDWCFSDLALLTTKTINTEICMDTTRRISFSFKITDSRVYTVIAISLRTRLKLPMGFSNWWHGFFLNWQDTTSHI